MGGKKTVFICRKCVNNCELKLWRNAPFLCPIGERNPEWRDLQVVKLRKLKEWKAKDEK
jgi:hypothetical protein